MNSLNPNLDSSVNRHTQLNLIRIGVECAVISGKPSKYLLEKALRLRNVYKIHTADITSFNLLFFLAGRVIGRRSNMMTNSPRHGPWSGTLKSLWR